MSQFIKGGKFKLSALVIVAVLICAVAFVVLSGFIGEPNATINEAENDLQVNIAQGSDFGSMSDDGVSSSSSLSSGDVGGSVGSGDSGSSGSFIVDSDNLGMVDIVSALIAANQSTLDIVVQVKNPIEVLSNQESAEFDIIVILENGEDVLQTYELTVTVNSTGFFSMAQDVQTKNQRPSQLNVDGNKFTVTTTLSELDDATQAEWNIYSSYQKLDGDQIVTSVYDFVPDEGLKTTIFGT
jgi:mannose/fructose/N-acetylgalactosamine-specific phosphotransferase system component IIB